MPHTCAAVPAAAHLILDRFGVVIMPRHAAENHAPCPPWQDISTLCANICVCERTVDAWVQQGILPPPRMRGGKRMWKWAEVDACLSGPEDGGVTAESIREATRRAVSERRVRTCRT
jgi:hypothetical protein